MRESLPAIQPFVRDRLTWLTYTMLAYIVFVQSMLGPLIPFLRSELRLNYTLGGFFPAALATGLILSGLFGDWLASRWSRRVLFWSGAIGLGASANLLGVSHEFEPALIAVLCMGIGSSLTLIMIQAILADQHGERRAVAFTEANVAASLSATFTPLVIGGLQNTGVGWRVITVPIVLFFLLVAAPYRREPIPQFAPVRSQSSARASRLPFSFWLYWIVLLLVVAVEMSVAVWATDFLASVAGLSRANAALAFGAFPAAMLIGRFVGSRLTRHWSSFSLLLATLSLTMIGFPIFWLAHTTWLNILGLFITGLGIANLYPLTLSIAVGLAAEQTNQASARASLAVGVALLTAPLLLGWLADRIGIQSAYGTVVILVIFAFASVIGSHLLLKREVISLP